MKKKPVVKKPLKSKNILGIPLTKEKKFYQLKRHELGVHKYETNSKTDQTRCYTNDPVILEKKNMDYMKKLSEEKNEVTIQSDYQHVEKVEVMLVQYRITPNGQIERMHQVPFKYDTKFHHTANGKMTLKLS